MSKTFLVAVDGSDHGWRALDVAADLAKACHAALVILHVIPHGELPEGLKKFAQVEGLSLEEVQARNRLSKSIGDKIVIEANARVRNAGLEQVETRVEEGHTANAIVATAESTAADMLFVGSRGLGDVQGLLLGSVSHKAMHLAPCTCVAVK